MTGGLAVLLGDSRLCAHHPGEHVRVRLDVTCLCLRPPRSRPSIEDLNVLAAREGSRGTERGWEGGRHRCAREKLTPCTAGPAGEATPSQSQVTVGHACPCPPGRGFCLSCWETHQSAPDRAVHSFDVVQPLLTLRGDPSGLTTPSRLSGVGIIWEKLSHAFQLQMVLRGQWLLFLRCCV